MESQIFTHGSITPIDGSESQSWRWRPQLGRWSKSRYGYPSLPVSIFVTTDSVPADQAYMYWRTVAFSDFEPDPDEGPMSQTFRARAEGVVWEYGDFYVTTSSAISGRRLNRHIRADGLDSLSIGLVLEGERRCEPDTDQAIISKAGQFFVYDGLKPSMVSWTDHRALFLVMRRPWMDQLFPQGVPSVSDMTERLQSSRLVGVLRDQFHTLMRNINRLPPQDQALLLQQTCEMVLQALRPVENAETDVAKGISLYHAARMMIERNVDNPRLGADFLARTLNCSRATLYRAFSAHGLAVNEHITELRLQRAHDLMLLGDENLSIAAISLKCGLLDTGNFSRRFRQRFGYSPTTLRANRKNGTSAGVKT